MIRRIIDMIKTAMMPKYVVRERVISTIESMDGAIDIKRYDVLENNWFRLECIRTFNEKENAEDEVLRLLRK